jgi:hypothetical protein
VGLLVHVAHYDYVSDDAFIFARYARNLVEGQGLVFNPGERVEGFTSMAWVLLLAGAGALGVDYVMAMRVLGIACALACVWLSHRLASQRMGMSWAAAAVVPVLVASAAPLACWSGAGLETLAFALAILCCLSAFEPDANARAGWSEGSCASLCLLLRPEGVLVPIALAVVRLRHAGVRGSVRAWRCWGLPVIALAALSAFRLAYYGDLVPNTARAKDAAGGQWLLGWEYARYFFADYGSLPLWLALLGSSLWHRAHFVAQAAGALSLALIAATIWVGGDGLCMYRFFVPVLPLFALLLGQAADTVAGLAASSVVRARVASALTLLIASLVAVDLASPDREDPQYGMYELQRRLEIPRWREAGLWLARNTAADASVACVPIGAVGYYSRRVIRDMVGLTDRHIAAQPSDPRLPLVGHRKHDGPYVLSLKPTILLLGNVRVRKEPLALSDPDFGRPNAPAIRMREEDMFGAELARNYEPRIAPLPSGEYLHYYARIGR